MPPELSVVINTLNEETRLGAALASVRGLSCDLVVVDMASDDRTCEIARAAGARVFGVERLGYADPARAYAIAQARHEWVLVLDADEVVSRPLAAEIREILRRDEVDAVELPYQNFMMGQAIRGGGWGPSQDHHLRLFRRSAVTVTATVHDFFQVHPHARRLRVPYRGDNTILHFSYDDLSHFLDKVNRYTTLEAGRPGPTSPATGLLLAGYEVVNRLIRKRGWQDGATGWHIALTMGYYRYLVTAKRRELARGRSAEANREAYRRRAAQELAPAPEEAGSPGAP